MKPKKSARISTRIVAPRWRRFRCLVLAGLLFATVVSPLTRVFAQGATITYQGRLDASGSAYTGTAEFQPTLWNAASSGTQVAANNPPSMIVNVTNGLFVLPLDFGESPFSAGADRWLQLEVRTALGPFTTLTPRQKLTSAPYAIHAANAATATTAASASSVAAANIVGTLNLTQLPAGVVTNHGTNVNLAGSFSGDGGSLSNVSANALVMTTTNVSISGWGRNDAGQRTAPPGLDDSVMIAVGALHSLALRANGTVVAWGAGETNDPSNSLFSGQTIVPAGLNNVTAVSAGFLHSLALKDNGTVVAWGYNEGGQTNVPPGLNNVTAISGGYFHNLALKTDGTVAVWGTNAQGQLNIPPGLNNVSKISAGLLHNLVLKNDGTVVAFGNNDYAQTNLPPGLGNVVAISAGGIHNLALKADGTVVAWGGGFTNDPGSGIHFGQSIVPAGLSNVVAIAAGYLHSVALKADGTVVAWGSNEYGQTNVPSLNNVVMLAQGHGFHALVHRPRSQAPVAWLDSDNTFNGSMVVNGEMSIAGSVVAEGDLATAGDLRVDGGDIWLRGNGDRNNGLGWYGEDKSFNDFFSPAPDGPVLFGNSGGGLGTTTNGQKIALSWDSSQQVGIGTTTPNARLSLGGGQAASKLLVHDEFGDRVGMGYTNAQFRFHLGNVSSRFSFLDSPTGTELVTIQKFNGFMGLGTVSPGGRLDVRGDIRLGPTGQYYAPAGQENLRIIRGVLTAAGVIITGTGFTPSRTGTGVYVITFSPAFGGLPTVTATADSQGGLARFAMTDGATASTTTIRVMVPSSHAATDAPVHFIAIGPR